MILLLSFAVLVASQQLVGGLIGGASITIPDVAGGTVSIPVGVGAGIDLDGLKAQIAALGGVGVDPATIATALGQIDMAKLQIKAADLQTAEAIAMANSQIMFANGQLKLASDLVLKANIAAKESFDLAAKLTVDASVQIKTQGLLVLEKTKGALEISSKGLVTAAGLVLSESNNVKVAADATLSVGLLQAQAGMSTIAGSFEVFSSHLFEVLKGAQVTLAAAAGATGAATVEADIALRDATSQLTLANDLVLKAQSKISGAGALIVQAKLDAQTAIDAAAQTSLEAGKLELAAASELLLKAKTDAATLLKIAGEAKFDGKLNIAADAAVKQIVLAYGSHVGTFDEVKVNGQAAVAAGGRKRATDTWTVTYGDKSATVTMSGGSTKPTSSASSLSIVSLASLLVAAFVAI